MADSLQAIHGKAKTEKTKSSKAYVWKNGKQSHLFGIDEGEVSYMNFIKQ